MALESFTGGSEMMISWFRGSSFLWALLTCFAAVLAVGLLVRVDNGPEEDEPPQVAADEPVQELLIVLIASSTCHGSHVDGFAEAVGKLASRMEIEAEERGMKPYLVGVALDRSIVDGMEFLSQLGSFDQVVVGMNWSNLGVQHYIEALSTGPAVVPQLLVLERTVLISDMKVDFLAEHVVVRAVGANEIISLSEKGEALTTGL
jgi:hypothetical protein